MMRSLFSAVSGLKSNQTAMDIIGNNIANVNTTGYKTSRTIFQDIFSQTISSATAPTATTGGSNPKQVGLGVSISTIGMNMTEGSTQSTSNPLDFAISGEGFFVVDDGSGSYKYTRNGALQLDSQGFLVTANGDYVMAVNHDTDSDGTPDVDNTDTFVTADLTKVQLLGDIYDTATPPALVDHYSDYAIDANGVITAVNNAGAKVTVGRVVLATFNNNGGLEKTGSSYYVVSSNSGTAKYGFVGNECGTLNSGSLEMSNVDLSTELTNMIITQRGFQANSRVITTTDSMLEELINLKR
ncbi:flagellar hook-basal body complex protein [Oscillospiraceae bacterium CM]|nr:flagellar hook-basal body complex protein [Oscillospiraceae bacterium CM]